MVKARICTAAYDAAGDMVCRAPTGTNSCSGGANTGQQLTWDLEARLSAWQDAPTSPTTTASYLYDGEGQRVAQKVTTSGTTTSTSYIGSLAEYTTTGGTTSRTDYLYAAGKLVAEAVTSGTPSTTTLTYLVTNAQGTPLEALDGSGAVTASRLYTPYGASRYTSGAFPTSYGYTGQRNDATTGLDYYGARYYDPQIAQFTSADTLMDGLSRYGYVGGNPTSATDPRGHMAEESEKGGGIAFAGEGGETKENLQNKTGGGGGGGVPAWVKWVSRALSGAMGLAMGFVNNPTVSSPGAGDDADRDAAFNARTAPYTPFVPKASEAAPSLSEPPGKSKPTTSNGTGDGASTPEPEAEPQPSTAGRGARRCTPEEMRLYPDACGVFDFLHGLRGDLGMAPNAGALVYLEIGTTFTYGYNAHGAHEQVRQTLGPNVITATHAEGLAFYMAYLQGVRSGTGTLYVDRSLCDACGLNGGVRTMVRNLGLSRLTVYELLEGGGIRISEILP